MGFVSHTNLREIRLKRPDDHLQFNIESFITRKPVKY